MGESFVTYAHHWCSTKRTRQKDGFSAIRLHQSCGGLAMTGRCWASCSDHVECWVGIFIMTSNGWSSLSLWRESPRATRMGRMMEISRMSKSLKRRLGRLFSCEHCHVLFASILLIICFPSFLPAFFSFWFALRKMHVFFFRPNLSRKLLDGLPGCPALSQSYQDPYQVEGFVHSHCWLYWKHIVHAVQAGDLWNLVAYFFRLEACWIENGKMRKSLGMSQQPVDFFRANGWSNTKLLRSWDVVCEIYGVASWCFKGSFEIHWKFETTHWWHKMSPLNLTPLLVWLVWVSGVHSWFQEDWALHVGICLENIRSASGLAGGFVLQRCFTTSRIMEWSCGHAAMVTRQTWTKRDGRFFLSHEILFLCVDRDDTW